MYNKSYAVFPSPAKLNLFLHITGRREDGYHELQTLFQFLDYGDTVEISPNDSGKITLLTPIKGVKNQDNLIVKAAGALKSFALNEESFDSQKSINLGADIKINKILPMGGGLGGGSSNAATVILALNKLWNLDIPTDSLAEMGLTLGADVPVFIRGFAAFAEGVGEKLKPVQPPEHWYLVSKPDCHISTQQVFTDPDLIRNTPKIFSDALDLSDVMQSYHNDCETLVIKRYPEVANLLAWLIEYAPSQMTGTGACIFSRFDSEHEARQLQKTLPKGISSFVAKGLNQSNVFAALAAIKEG